MPTTESSKQPMETPFKMRSFLVSSDDLRETPGDTCPPLHAPSAGMEDDTERAFNVVRAFMLRAWKRRPDAGRDADRPLLAHGGESG